MIKVITYGTYDLLHYGHIRLLERAKALGDYLIVGVTSDDYDKERGKINNQQSLMERIEAIRNTGLADEIIVEEHDGQKIDDIKKYNVDIFTVGSDWEGKFDYLNEYCKVVYLERTKGVSSSDIRSEHQELKLLVTGDSPIEKKFVREAVFVNGVSLTSKDEDAVYVFDKPENHYKIIKDYLQKGKSVLCESPITINKEQTIELFELAKKNNCFLFDGIKTAYSTAFSRLVLLVKSGAIGDVVSVETTCTSMRDVIDDSNVDQRWNSITDWGPTALLPIFQLLGTNYKDMRIITKYYNKEKKFDAFTKVEFVYPHAVASIKVAKKAKSEGELVVTGTKGYIVVPSPWWKTDYFEVRYENPQDNKRYFYQLDGEGIRYEIAAFVKSVTSKKNFTSISKDVSVEISKVIEDYYNDKVIEIE